MLLSIGFERLQSAMMKKGYPFYTRGDYNLNIVGIRSSDINSNAFNDVLCVLFYWQGAPILLTFDATTDPGVYWRENPMNVNGTAIVVPDHYRGLWQIGMHQNKYDALVQRREICVYRDADCDHQLSANNVTIERGFFGINCHHASFTGTSQCVDKWSAGCQVVADIYDFNVFMALCHKSADLHGNRFSYTLLQEEDLL